VPYPFFFFAVTFVVAFIPAAGAASVCLAAAGLRLLSGHPWMALFLAIYAIVVVGLVDNVVKPLLMKGGIQMHGAVVFFALLGGLAAFGAMGLLIGPLAVALFLAMVRIYKRDYSEDPRQREVLREQGVGLRSVYTKQVDQRFPRMRCILGANFQVDPGHLVQQRRHAAAEHVRLILLERRSGEREQFLQCIQHHDGTRGGRSSSASRSRSQAALQRQ
jgi:hypothetical protein